MINENDIKTGDLGIIIKPKTLLGKLIGLLTNNKSHAFCLVWGFNGVEVYEMLSKGIKKTYFKDFDFKCCIILTPNIEYTKGEQVKFKSFLINAYNASYKYDFNTLLKHLYFDVIGYFPEEKKFDKKLICSELAALAANSSKPFTFGLTESITPEDIFNSKFYHVSSRG